MILRCHSAMGNSNSVYVPTVSSATYSTVGTHRFDMVTVLGELSEEQLVSILTDTRSALTKQYSKLMAMEGVELEFTQEALRELEQQARRGADSHD